MKKPGERADVSDRLLSVGHSNHELEHFLALLSRAGVGKVADVRSSPYSRRLPQYCLAELEAALESQGIGYVFLGEQLGGRPRLAELYNEAGQVDYELVRRTAEFQNGLDHLITESDRCCTAMLCSEEDPLDCHRGLMITPALGECGLAPGHLRKDGSIESTAAMEQRLLGITGVGAGLWDGLFSQMISEDERRQMLVEAYRAMAARKAFRQADGF